MLIWNRYDSQAAWIRRIPRIGSSRLLLDRMCDLPANSFASANVLSYAVSSGISTLSPIIHTVFFCRHPFQHLSFFSSPCGLFFGGSEDAITCQYARHRNAAARIAPFKIKCVKHMFPEGSIHYMDYDKDIFTCIQSCQTEIFFIQYLHEST